MSKHFKTSLLHLKVSPEWVEMIDRWRSERPERMSRTAALQALIERGFTSNEPERDPADIADYLPADLKARIVSMHKRHRWFTSKSKLIVHLLERSMAIKAGPPGPFLDPENVAAVEQSMMAGMDMSSFVNDIVRRHFQALSDAQAGPGRPVRPLPENCENGPEE